MLEADFVVDAMGRSSRLAHWVDQGGFEGPRLERLATSINYATGLFERPDQLADLDVTSVLAISTPETAVDGISIATMTAVEDNQWIVGLIGYGHDRPGTTIDQMRTSCAKLHPAFGRAVQRLATRGVQTYHQDDSRRRHFTEHAPISGSAGQRRRRRGVVQPDLRTGHVVVRAARVLPGGIPG